MRHAVVVAVVAVLAATAGGTVAWFSRVPVVGLPPANLPSVEFDVKLARITYLEPTIKEDQFDAVLKRIGDPTVSRIEFEGKAFWLVDLHRGMGVPYKSIGLYAPDGEGSHKLVLEAESCGAGNVKPELDAATGTLVLREHASSDLEGQIILSCNLRSIGTYQSVHGK